jgi:hypothetical protein
MKFILTEANNNNITATPTPMIFKVKGFRLRNAITVVVTIYSLICYITGDSPLDDSPSRHCNNHSISL